jgi:hypothetical protein
LKKSSSTHDEIYGNGGEVILPEKAKCPGCGAEFDSYDKLINHVVEAHESNCQICGANLNTKEELLQHNKEKHGK